MYDQKITSPGLKMPSLPKLPSNGVIKGVSSPRQLPSLPGQSPKPMMPGQSTVVKANPYFKALADRRQPLTAPNPSLKALKERRQPLTAPKKSIPDFYAKALKERRQNIDFSKYSTKSQVIKEPIEQKLMERDKNILKFLTGK